MRINFELLDLRAFLAVFDLDGFHKAGEQLNLSQSTLSRRIQALEVRLGTPLFERSTRTVVPTAAGRKLEPIARRMLAELDSSLKDISDPGEQPSGKMTIASIPSAASVLVPPIIKEFNLHYPLVRVRVLNRRPREAIESVMVGEADLGINVLGSIETEITFSRLLDDPYVVVCRHDHPLGQKTKISWRTLAGYRLVRVGRATGSFLDSALAKAGAAQVDWFYEVDDWRTAFRLVEIGLAATVLPRLAAPNGANRLFSVVPIHPQGISRTIGVVERRKGHLSQAAQRFRDILLSNHAAPSDK